MYKRQPPIPYRPSPTIKKTKKVTHFGVKLSDLVETGYLKVGDRLVPSTEKGYAKRYSGEGIVIERNGKIYIDINGVLHSFLSPAAMAVSGQTSEPGWDFWERSSNGKTLDEIRAKYLLDVRGLRI